jgi:hypothetical protein
MTTFFSLQMGMGNACTVAQAKLQLRMAFDKWLWAQ